MNNEQIERKIDGWNWVVGQLRAAADRARDEAERLVGPARGE